MAERVVVLSGNHPSESAASLVKVLTTDQKGSIAEWGVSWHAMRLGIDVFRPLNDGTRCDLIFDLAGKRTRVQVKRRPRTINRPESTGLTHTISALH
jgi:PD-(D/E)XK endonuclease